MSLLRAAFTLGVALPLLGACAVLMPRETLPRAAPFDVLGRVAVGYGGNAFSSNLRWQHGTDRDELWLMTPTGQALAHMRDDDGGATLTVADQTRYQGASVESLTQQGLGWVLPLTRLQHWIRGVAVPGGKPDIIERDAGGRVMVLAQDGWRIRYEYSEAPEYQGLPRRVELTGDAQSIRLVIDQWRREAPSGEVTPSVFITR